MSLTGIYNCRSSSRVGNRILSTLSGVKFHDFSCTFKAFQSGAAKKIAQRLDKGFHRFIPLLGKKMNLDICEIEISHKPRIYGISKYRFLKYIEALRSLFVYVVKQGDILAMPKENFNRDIIEKVIN